MGKIYNSSKQRVECIIFANDCIDVCFVGMSRQVKVQRGKNKGGGNGNWILAVLALAGSSKV